MNINDLCMSTLAVKFISFLYQIFPFQKQDISEASEIFLLRSKLFMTSFKIFSFKFYLEIRTFPKLLRVKVFEHRKSKLAF